MMEVVAFFRKILRYFPGELFSWILMGVRVGSTKLMDADAE